jgi:hypothetical protein
MVSPALSILSQVPFFLLVALALILGSTWFVTNLQFHAHAKRLAAGKDKVAATEPLMLPYAIPWLGSSIGFLTEQAGFWAKMK